MMGEELEGKEEVLAFPGEVIVEGIDERREVQKAFLGGPVLRLNQKVVASLQKRHEEVISWIPELGDIIRIWGAVAEASAACSWQKNFDEKTKLLIHQALKLAIGFLLVIVGAHFTVESYDFFRKKLDEVGEKIGKGEIEAIFEEEEKVLREFLEEAGIEILLKDQRRIGENTRGHEGSLEEIVKRVTPVLEEERS